MSTPDTKTAKKRNQWPRVRFVEGRPRPWMVDTRLKLNGKPTGERHFYASAAEADTKAEAERLTRRNGGTDSAELSSRDRSDAIEAKKKLSAIGATFMQAVDYFLAHHEQQKRSVPVKDAVTAFLAHKGAERMSGRYTKDLRVRLGKFAEAFGSQQIGAVSPEAITDWLAAMPVAPLTRNTFRLRLSALFAFAKQKKWRALNPFTGGKKAEVATTKERRKKVQRLTLDEVCSLLASPVPEIRAFWAIAIFAGLRPESELARLRWEDIDIKERVIVVDGEASAVEETKTGRRTVVITDNLAAWLLPLTRKSGLVRPTGNYWMKLRADKRRAGFGSPGSETPEEKAAGMKLKRWIADLTRHTYGSQLLAHCGDIGVVSTQMGNSPDMVRKHYLALVKPSEATAFWALAPAKDEGKVIAMKPAVTTDTQPAQAIAAAS